MNDFYKRQAIYDGIEQHIKEHYPNDHQLQQLMTDLQEMNK